MNTFGNNKPLGLAFSSQIAFLLAIAILLWAVGAPALLQRAHAANLTTISDTLSTSNLSSNAKHVIHFTTASAIPVGGTIKVSFDTTAFPGGAAAFAEAGSAATSSDIFIGTSTPTGYAVVAACTSGNQATVAANYNNGSDENLTFTICGTSVTPIAATTSVQMIIGSSTALITNPAATGSYRINVTASNGDTGETRVAVLQNVTLTAAVSTSFTFTVSGVATTTPFFGTLATTSASSTATSLPFGFLSPGTTTVLAQALTVATNARNGFAVTVQENQPPTSSTGATIDLFSNGATTSTPILWTGPTNQLDVPSTYGHFGVTSDDADENSNEFLNATKWAGNIDQPRVVFSHTGPADGTTQNKGKAMVGFKIEIGPLQEAGSDYTNTITYVATPTF